MPTQDQKVRILEHIYYEILRCFKFDPGEEKFTEYWISHMIHARVLLDFFEAEKERSDDVVCTQFGFPARKVDIASEHWTRLNKDVNHLTYSRLRHTPETKGWDIRSALIPLAQRAVEFMDHVILYPPIGAANDELERWIVLRNFIRDAVLPKGQHGSSGTGL
jgi:hypothetical protein